MNDLRLNTFTSNELNALLALIATYPQNIPKSAVKQILYLDVGLQQILAQTLGTYLVKLQNISKP